MAVLASTPRVAASSAARASRASARVAAASRSQFAAGKALCRVTVATGARPRADQLRIRCAVAEIIG